jgi:hypothetical protein
MIVTKIIDFGFTKYEALFFLYIYRNVLLLPNCVKIC